jgi:hypothetical protein
MLILKEMFGDTKGVIRRRFKDGRKIQWQKIVHTMMFNAISIYHMMFLLFNSNQGRIQGGASGARPLKLEKI